MDRYRRVLLQDNVDITEAEYAAAAEIRHRVSALVETREEFVRSRELDPEFCLPAGNWGDETINDFLTAYRHILNGDRDVLNRLRFFVQVFPGYQLMSLGFSSGLPSVNPIPPDFDNWIQKLRPEPDEFVLLLAHLVSNMPRHLMFSPPCKLGEIGWEVEGIVANHDTYIYQGRITLLYEAGILQRLYGLGRPPRILEIGGGYGALALALHQILGPVDYVICDLPESLLFSSLYLFFAGGLQPHLDGPPLIRGLRMLPNYRFSELLSAERRFDLVINTLSMSEMTRPQVEVYGAGIAHLLSTGAVFFEQNHDNRPIGQLYAKEIVAPYFTRRQTIESRLLNQLWGAGADLWWND